MCIECWEHYNSPRIDTPAIRRAAELVRELYEDEHEITGGMLHVQLDDWNIEDCFWEDPVFEQYLIDLHKRQPLPVEKQIVELFASLTEEERASALALNDGYWS